MCCDCLVLCLTANCLDELDEFGVHFTVALRQKEGTEAIRLLATDKHEKTRMTLKRVAAMGAKKVKEK